jgi:hypothetical protein
MSNTVKAIEHNVVVDGETIRLKQGDEYPDSLPADVRKALIEAESDSAIEPAADDVVSEPITGDYESHKKDDLQAEADRRGLEVEGTGADGAVVKDDLVEALEADDAA